MKPKIRVRMVLDKHDRKMLIVIEKMRERGYSYTATGDVYDAIVDELYWEYEAQKEQQEEINKV